MTLPHISIFTIIIKAPKIKLQNGKKLKNLHSEAVFLVMSDPSMNEM